MNVFNRRKLEEVRKGLVKADIEVLRVASSDDPEHTLMHSHTKLVEVIKELDKSLNPVKVVRLREVKTIYK